MTYNSVTIGRFNELVQGSYHDNDGANYTVDRDGNMIRIERPRYQVEAARQSVKNNTKSK